MKFLRFVFPIVFIFSMLLSACSPNTKEVILQPSDPNNTSIVAGIDNSKTAQDLYNDCVQDAKDKAAWIITVQIGNEPVVVTGCQTAPVDQADLLLVPAMTITKIIPGQGDDVAVYGAAVIEKVAYVLVKAAIVIAAGEVIRLNLQRATVVMFATVPSTHGTVMWQSQNDGCFGGVRNSTGKQLTTWVDVPCPKNPNDTNGIKLFLQKIRESFNNRMTGYSWERLLAEDREAAEILQMIAEDHGVVITIP